MQPKVSLVIPCYNVERYVRQCVESAQNQTLEDIEIICVNDGSTDGTLAILQELAAGDDRIKIIDKPNEGYGRTMNRGFDAATGEYIGILESDDFVDPDMLETYYDEAKQYDADIVKSNFFYYWSAPEERNELSGLVFEDMCGRVMDPLDDDRVFHIQPSIWAAIYKADFIRKNDIRFKETPGASYQDTSFAFEVFAFAKRVVFVHKAFLHYRQDNEASSINSPGKVFCVCGEYEKIEDRLREMEDAERSSRLHEVLMRTKFNGYLWNYYRLSGDLRKDFLEEFSAQFKAHRDNGEIVPSKFEWHNLRDMDLIIDDPDFFNAISFYGPDRPRLKTVLHTLKAGGPKYFRKLLALQRGR